MKTKTKQCIMISIDITLVELMDKVYTNKSKLINELLKKHFKDELQKDISTDNK